MLTKSTVRKAPASPERKYLALRNAGNIAASAGITYVAVKSAMTPAMNPKSATKRKTFNLSLITFTFWIEFNLSLFLV